VFLLFVDDNAALRLLRSQHCIFFKKTGCWLRGFNTANVDATSGEMEVEPHPRCHGDDVEEEEETLEVSR
jgi:hypothetical protein